jgi:hypothetical protein
MEEVLLPFCLRDATHDWRLLQLVNRSMCVVYRQLLKKEMDGVLVSVQSEVDGNKAECVRNELHALFDVWVGWGEQHRTLGREIMIDKLYADGLRLSTRLHVGCCGGQGRVIVWRGRRVERIDYGEAGHTAARNGMAVLLRKELQARWRWPVPARPRSDPQHLHAVL